MPEMTRRGSEHVWDVGGVRLTFRSGVDSPDSTPVHDLTAGELFVHNRGDRAVRLRFNGAETFVRGFRWTFGAQAQNEFSLDARECGGGEDDNEDETLAAGETMLLGRVDFMMLVDFVTVDGLVDGSVATFYRATLQIDQHVEQIDIGPHAFRVGLARDWEAERNRYVKYIEASFEP